jgi:hypothetical protein
MNELKCIVIAFLLLLSADNFAQTSYSETDQGIVASIAAYDGEVRRAILKASEYPEVLTQLQRSQSQSVTLFQETIERLNRTQQTLLYILTRYPDLIRNLADLPSKQSEDVVYKLLPNQDPDLKTAAWKLYRYEKKYLVKIDNIQVAIEREFDRIIQQVDQSGKVAFQKLIKMPDVLTLLTNNVGLATRLGENYKNDSSQLINHLAALHDSLEVQNQYEATFFKKHMTDYPQAMKEFKKANDAYAKSNGYNPDNPYYYGNPYSYWFGYPWWYTTPIWYPGGFGYNPAFYFGFPSYGFSYWFFHEGHYRKYPRLYRKFGNYYYDNLSDNRVMGSINRGLMAVAHEHYEEEGGLNTLISPWNYNRPSGQQSQNLGRITTPFNANTYHMQSWSAYGGRNNSTLAGYRRDVRGGDLASRRSN